MIEKELKKSNHYFIEVSDDGVGIPNSIDIHKTDSLGLQLIDMLTEQLGGTLNLDRTKGTKFTIRFPVEKTENT